MKIIRSLALLAVPDLFKLSRVLRDVEVDMETALVRLDVALAKRPWDQPGVQLHEHIQATDTLYRCLERLKDARAFLGDGPSVLNEVDSTGV